MYVFVHRYIYLHDVLSSQDAYAYWCVCSLMCVLINCHDLLSAAYWSTSTLVTQCIHNVSCVFTTLCTYRLLANGGDPQIAAAITDFTPQTHKITAFRGDLQQWLMWAFLYKHTHTHVYAHICMPMYAHINILILNNIFLKSVMLIFLWKPIVAYKTNCCIYFLYERGIESYVLVHISTCTIDRFQNFRGWSNGFPG